MTTPTPAELAQRATREHARAADLRALATSIEDDATRLAATGDPVDAESAADFREEAAAVRTAAADHARRAAQYEQVARGEIDLRPTSVPTEAGTEPAFEQEG
jgi:hypothetical protein